MKRTIAVLGLVAVGVFGTAAIGGAQAGNNVAEVSKVVVPNAGTDSTKIEVKDNKTGQFVETSDVNFSQEESPNCVTQSNHTCQVRVTNSFAGSVPPGTTFTVTVDCFDRNQDPPGPHEITTLTFDANGAPSPQSVVSEHFDFCTISETVNPGPTPGPGPIPGGAGDGAGGGAAQPVVGRARFTG